MPRPHSDTAAALGDGIALAPVPSALTAHFGAVYRDLLRFIARRTGNDDDARDLAHDTWLRLAELERHGHLAPPAQPRDTRAYLFTVAHHLAIDHLRRRRLANNLSVAPTPAEPDVADAVMYGQAVQAVEAALQALPERARDVFLAHRLQGVGQAELAEQHGLSRNMIERDVMLAMDHVQAAMEQWHGGGNTAARKGRRRSLGALLGLAGLFTTGGAAWQAWRQLVPQWQTAVSTRRGQTLHQVLPDGSGLTLDAASGADVTFYATRRAVRLHAGAVFFDVARDTARPFVIDAGRVRITVLGTRFGVELDDPHTEVQVEHGLVQVHALDAHGAPGEPAMLRDGEALRVVTLPDGGGARIERRPSPPSVVAPWRTGVLAFDCTPLNDAVRRLERYGGAAVVVDPRVADLPVSGQVQIPRAHDWLQALPAVLPVRVERQAAGTGWHIAPR